MSKVPPPAARNSLTPPPPFYKQAPMAIALIILGGLGLALAGFTLRGAPSRRFSLGLAFAAGSLVALMKGVSDLWKCLGQPKALASRAATPLPPEEITQVQPQLEPQTLITPSETPPPLAENIVDQQLSQPISAQELLLPSEPQTSIDRNATSQPPIDNPINPNPIPQAPIEKLPPPQTFSPVSSVIPIPEKQTPTIYKVPLYITQIDSGYIGDPVRCRKYYFYLKYIRLEDGSPMPLEPHDFFVPISVHYDGCPPEIANIPYELCLPYKFLENKEEGNSYRFRYKDVLLEFTIDQQQGPATKMHLSFKEMLAFVKRYVKKYWQIETPLFGTILDPIWFYRLGTEGSIFKVNHQGLLEEMPATKFRQKKAPNFVHGTVEIKDGKCVFCCEMTLVKLVDIDIIINNEAIIIYASKDDPTIFRPIPPGATWRSQDRLLMQMVSGKIEWLFAIAWEDYPELKSLGLERIKKKIMQEPITTNRGFVQFSFPLDHPHPDQILLSSRGNPFHTLSRAL
jgi:hypothetical protein